MQQYGDFTIHGGIIIILSAMWKVLVDRASKIVAVQGGANLGRGGSDGWAEDLAGLRESTVWSSTI
jgi:drug/metabolite transporter superfamily protein YnfA